MSTPTPKEEEKKPEVAVPEAAAEEKKEEAVAAPKNKNALRRSVERTFRGIGRTLSRSRSRGQSSGNLLPKVFRAKGRKEEKTSSGKKKTKGKKDAKKEVVQRKKAPQLSKTLSSLLSSQEDFALYIGKDLVNTKFSNVDETLLLEVFENELWSTLLDEDAFTSAKVTLAGEEKADVKVKNIELKYKEFLGETAYYNALKTILLKMEEDVDSSSTALVATLIKAVRPKFIIYAGTDSSLQDAFKHDNFPVKACTLNDLQAEGFKAASLTGSLKQKKMLKINGDFSQPETLAFTQEAKFSNFGFDASGKTSENNGKYLKAVLRDVTSTMPVVYVGAALDRNDPLSFVLKELNEGAEKAVTSVALVDEIAKDSTVQRFDSKEIGVEYIIYSPDENKTQLVEFLASMASCVATSAPIVSETNPKIFTKAYVQSAALADAMVALGERELTARAICMFANDLTTCDFVEEPSFKDAVSIPAMFKKGAPDAKDNAKREALEAALTKKVTELHEKLLGSGEEKEEVLLKLLLSAGSMKADITKDTEFNDVIRLKYEALLKLVEASNGKLEVRVVDSTEDSLTSDFTLLFLGEKGFGDVALITEEESEHFALSVYQENTNAAEEKVLLFERLWNVALSKKDSVAAIKQTLELPVEVEAKVEKKRLFSAPFFKKKEKVEKEKEAAPVEEKAKDPAPVEKVEEPKKEEEAKEGKKDEAPKEEEKPKKGMFSNPFARKKDKKEKADKSKKEAVPEPTSEPAAETKDEVKEEIKELKEEKIVETVVAATEEKKADEDKKAAEEEAPKENEKENKKAAAKKPDKAKADKKAKTLKKDKDKKKTDKKDTKKKTDKKDAKVEKKDKKKTDKKEAKAEAKVEKTEEKVEKVEEKVEAKEAAPELEAKIEDLEKQEEEGAPVEEKTDKKLTKKEKAALAKKERVDKAAATKKEKAAASKKKDKKEKLKKETKKEETKIEIVDDVKEKAAELTAQVDKKEEAKVEKAAEEVADVKEDKIEAEAEPKADVEEKKEEAPKSPGVMSKFASKMKSTLPRGKKDKKKPAEKKEESAAAEEKPAEVATAGKKEEAVKA